MSRAGCGALNDFFQFQMAARRLTPNERARRQEIQELAHPGWKCFDFDRRALSTYSFTERDIIDMGLLRPSVHETTLDVHWPEDVPNARFIRLLSDYSQLSKLQSRARSSPIYVANWMAGLDDAQAEMYENQIEMTGCAYYRDPDREFWPVGLNARRTLKLQLHAFCSIRLKF